MRRSSWIVLGACTLLCLGMLGAYLLSRSGATAPNASTQIDAMLHEMRGAVAEKNVGRIMQYVSNDPDTHIANLRPDQLRLLLARGFRGSGDLAATYGNVHFSRVGDDGTAEFDLVVKDKAANMLAEDYTGHITLHLKRVEVPRLLGLMHAREWRIVGAETTGRDPGAMGDY